MANIFYDFPTRGLKVVGVTGTDGKTTTVNMIYQILKAAGKKISMVSTINAPGFHVTSPDPFMVQKFARESVDKGDEYLVLEVTSHGLDQYRFWGIKFEIGVITNITHEHLDYHKTFKKYFDTKMKLLQNAKFAIKPKDFKKIKTSLTLKILGAYNKENALAALAVSNVLGINPNIARAALENFTGLSGRMEEVKNKKGIRIIIDFAHTPNGLENALKTLHSGRGHAKGGRGRIISLIGCEGLRDVGKRAMMGEIAQRLSDIVIVTAVDPRGEIKDIVRQIKKGSLKAGAKQGKNFYIIEDRQKAINFAIRQLARKEDTIGIFGKGHENSMNLDGRKEIPWSDRKAIRKALNG